jgi:hypothetical protein
MYHNFVSGHHDFLQTEPKKKKKASMAPTPEQTKSMQDWYKEMCEYDEAEHAKAKDTKESFQNYIQGHYAKSPFGKNNDQLMSKLYIFLEEKHGEQIRGMFQFLKLNKHSTGHTQSAPRKKKVGVGESKESTTEAVIMMQGFVYKDDVHRVVFRRDGTLIVTDDNMRQIDEVYFDFDEFIQNQDDGYLETIRFFSLIKGEKYVDSDGKLIVYQKNGKLKYNRKTYNTFEKFLGAQPSNFFDSVGLYSAEDDSDSEEEQAIIGTLKKVKYALKRDEAACLSDKCQKPRQQDTRKDQSATADQIHKDVTYEFLDWEEDDDDYGTNRRWLADNQRKMTCILSVSLAKPDNSANFIDDTRRTMLLNAITGWTDHEWSVLLFVPAQNSEQYIHCAKLKRIFGSGVNIVPYRIEQGTCNVNMNVGESRNAILHFMLANKDLVKTCTVADERVETLLRPRPVLSNATFNLSDEPIIVARQRAQEGYERLAAVKEFMEIGSTAETTFKRLQEASDEVWDVYTPRENKYCRSVVQLYDAASPDTSVWHALQAHPPTLIGLPTDFRANMRKTDPSDLHGKERYTQWNVSKGGKFIGADVEPFAPTRLVMPTQLITFKVGEGGWNGQFFYPFTTIGEDNFFSYQWGKYFDDTVGMTSIAQLDAVQIIRKFPKKAVSITRTPDNLNGYTDCAIKELIYIIASDTYVQGKQDSVSLRWTPYSGKQTMRMSCYKWQCFIFSQIVAQANKRKFECSAKVKSICDALLKFILSASFRSTVYFKERNKATYNAMIDVYRNNKEMKKYIQKLQLQIPVDR